MTSENPHQAGPGERDLEEALDPAGSPTTEEVSGRVEDALSEVREDVVRRAGPEHDEPAEPLPPDGSGVRE